MNELTEELSYELARHSNWNWEDGILGLRWAPGFRDHLKPEGRDPSWNKLQEPSNIPDLDDPATQGWLIEFWRRGICLLGFGSLTALMHSGVILGRGDLLARAVLLLWDQTRTIKYLFVPDKALESRIDRYIKEDDISWE